MSRRKTDIRDFAWWICVFGFGFIMALAILNAAWNYDVTPEEQEPVAEETMETEEEKEVIHTIESDRVSGAQRVDPPVRENEQAEEAIEQPQLKLLGWFKVTAYCACQKCCGKSPDHPAYGITATGTRATQGRTIAVDPRVIPYGTVLYFEGPDGLIGGYIAEDCGGAIKGNRIDLYFDSHEEALKWGVKELDIYII